ncbi:MAG: FkbM family methyltransferase [Tannerella sp.]|jgi:FkbM family methyltransferase|nr:FkbM family methyltransferase [Tannerella sp.]
MEFKELLKTNEKANDVAIIEKLQQSGHPVILYGATVDVADQIVKKLAANNIQIALVAFDDESPLMTKSTQLLTETETARVETIDQRFPAYHIIPGFVKSYARIDHISHKFAHARSVDYLSEIFDMEIIEPSFILENKDFLEDFYEHLSDQYSKDSYVAYLLSKTRQDMKYLPPIFEKIQYFPGGIFKLSRDESYFDCGAFTGDTIADFLKATGGTYRHIWAAEPDKSNYRQLMDYIRKENLTNIDVVNKGIYGYAGKLPFQESGSMLSMISEDAGNFIEVDTIDNIVDGNPVTYIKMDVEGAELMALKGAEKTIRANKPILGISIYHKQDDLVDIPQYITSLVPEYKFYFRVHKKLAIDTVLYGLVE